MLRRVASSLGSVSAPRTFVSQNRCVSSAMKEKIIQLNEYCKPYSVSEAKKFGPKGEIILEDELLLDRYVEELDRSFFTAQVPKNIPYEVIAFFFASRGSITVANAVLAHQNTNFGNISEKSVEAVCDGLIQFGDFEKAYNFYQIADATKKLDASAYSIMAYGAIRDGKFEEFKQITKDCETRFVPPALRSRIVQ